MIFTFVLWQGLDGTGGFPGLAGAYGARGLRGEQGDQGPQGFPVRFHSLSFSCFSDLCGLISQIEFGRNRCMYQMNCLHNYNPLLNLYTVNVVMSESVFLNRLNFL